MTTRIALPRDRRGMTLVELMAAVLIAGIVLSLGLAFFNTQARALRAGTGQFVLTQNYRMALSTLAREVRTAGTHTVAGQPFLVYAGPDAVAFNADYVSRDRNELFSASVDTAAPPGETEALTKPGRIAIPTSAFSYPDTSYLQGGINSGAETMVFYFALDTTTTRTDDYALFRKVNGGAPAVVARNLLRTPGRPFFEYLYLMDHDSTAATVELWSNVVLTHSAPVHGRPDGARPDTGAAALIDRIRGVRVNVTATDGTTGAAERRRSVTRTVLLANAGVTRLESCGEVPTFGGGFGTAPSPAGAATPTVTLSWGPAVDESAGEKDVLRYIVWKRVTGSGDWGPPFMSIPAGLAAYSYVDDQVQHGQTYDYAIAAQDCTPSQSPQILATVRVP
jgi:prepilin-type N-terminal cleavage/methylation domain-containing protein